ncbi:Hypothetical protein, putative [Bodo saltans]|uniref:Uncharacterized protein n=1 Tax=Bodo saltans TaxID=75058 RepID=A0A0S4KMC7_BODSA|nr:Hypothetical protein, putative [Bodo saltans]|eukprot:CUI14788.1 Hypothetical protein, putative [Bodo saltans]
MFYHQEQAPEILEEHRARAGALFSALDSKWSAALGERPSSIVADVVDLDTDQQEGALMVVLSTTATSPRPPPTSSKLSSRRRMLMRAHQPVSASSRFGVLSKHQLHTSIHPIDLTPEDDEGHSDRVDFINHNDGTDGDEGIVSSSLAAPYGDGGYPTTATTQAPRPTPPPSSSSSAWIAQLTSVTFDESFFRLALCADEDGQFSSLQLLLPLFVGYPRQRTAASTTPLAPAVSSVHVAHLCLAKETQTRAAKDDVYHHLDDDHDTDIDWRPIQGIKLPHPPPISTAVVSASRENRVDAHRFRPTSSHELVIRPEFPDNDQLHARLHAAELRLALTISTTRENLVRCVDHEALMRAYIEFETVALMSPLLELEAEAHHSIFLLWLEEEFLRSLLVGQLGLLRLEEAARLTIEGKCWSCKLTNRIDADYNADAMFQRLADEVVAYVLARKPYHLHDEQGRLSLISKPHSQKQHKHVTSRRRGQAPPETDAPCALVLGDRRFEELLQSWTLLYCPCLALDAELRLFLSGIPLPADPHLTCAFVALVVGSYEDVEGECLSEHALFVDNCAREWDILCEWSSVTERLDDWEVRDRQRICDYAHLEMRRVLIEVQLREAVRDEVVSRLTLDGNQCMDDDAEAKESGFLVEVQAATTTGTPALQQQREDINHEVEEQEQEARVCNTIALAADNVSCHPASHLQELLDRRMLPMSFALFCRLRELEYTEAICRKLSFDLNACYIPELCDAYVALEQSCRKKLDEAQYTAVLALLYPPAHTTTTTTTTTTERFSASAAEEGSDDVGHNSSTTNDMESSEVVACHGIDGLQRHWIIDKETKARNELKCLMDDEHKQSTDLEFAHARWTEGCVAAALVAGRSSPTPSPRNRSASPSASMSRSSSPAGSVASTTFSFREPSHFLHWEQQRRNQISLLEMQWFIQATSLSRAVLRQIASESLLRGSTSGIWRAADEAGAAIARAHDIRGLLRSEEGDRSRLVAARYFHIAEFEEQAAMMRSVVTDILVIQRNAQEEIACLLLSFEETLQRHSIEEAAKAEEEVFYVSLKMPKRVADPNRDACGNNNFAQQLLTDLVRYDICDLDLARIAFV